MLYVRAAVGLVLIGIILVINVISFRAGEWRVQAAWDRDVAEFTELMLAKEQQARAKEQALVDEKQRVEVLYEQEKRRRAAAAASAGGELDRLRHAIVTAARARAGGEAPDARPGTDAAPVERELFGECAAALHRMAETADRLAAQVAGLQGYVTNVCVK
jgi:hypothetical protein